VGKHSNEGEVSQRSSEIKKSRQSTFKDDVVDKDNSTEFEERESGTSRIMRCRGRKNLAILGTIKKGTDEDRGEKGKQGIKGSSREGKKKRDRLHESNVRCDGN